MKNQCITYLKKHQYSIKYGIYAIISMHLFHITDDEPYIREILNAMVSRTGHLTQVFFVRAMIT